MKPFSKTLIRSELYAAQHELNKAWKGLPSDLTGSLEKLDVLDARIKTRFQ